MLPPTREPLAYLLCPHRTLGTALPKAGGRDRRSCTLALVVHTQEKEAGWI